MTVGLGRVRATVGIPGSGISWTASREGRGKQARAHARGSVSNKQTAIGCLILLGGAAAIVATIATSGLILIPAGVALVAWLVYRHRRPRSVAGRLIGQVGKLPPEQAVHLYHHAMDVDPHGARTAQLCAEWFFAHDCYADAVDAYAVWIRHQHPGLAELRHAQALLRAGEIQKAISELQTLRTSPMLSEDGQLTALSDLALSFYWLGDPGQGLAIANIAPLQRRTLSGGAAACLLMRATGRYLTGDRARAIQDIDRLYANTAEPDVLEVKRQMTDQSYQPGAPNPYPHWYPKMVELPERPAMKEIPSGTCDVIEQGRLSSDSQPRMDGSPRQEVKPAAAAPPTAGDVDAPPAGSARPQFSADRLWWWNGREWVSAVSQDGRYRWDGEQWVPPTGRGS